MEIFKSLSLDSSSTSFSLSYRSDYLWRSKLISEQEGVDTMRGINKILLENILPAHVAEHYLLRAQGVAGVLKDTNVSFYDWHSILIDFTKVFNTNLKERRC
jgi:hypothetical protein